MAASGRNWLVVAAIAVVAVAGWYTWKNAQGDSLPPGIATGNGRIEAVEIDVASKMAGRIEEIQVNEGDLVSAGQPLARLETRQLQASLRQAEAELKRARIGVDTANILVEQRQAEKRSTEASLAQAKAVEEAANRQFLRSQQLRETDAVSLQVLDAHRADALGAAAAVSAAEAALAASNAAINSAKASVINAEAAVEAAEATIDSIKVQIDDSTLVAPRDGRVQYLVAREGEIVAAGGRIINLADLSDVYMSIFLPTEQAGRIAIGTPARIVLDAAPDLAVPATISYVADVAQFTPKTVETEIERQKLMFRIRAQIDKDLLLDHIEYVKTGLPGVTYVKVDPNAEFPAEIESKLAQQ
ncbi:MAG: hypothetical protein CMH69_19160 [Nitratireductor sp.]|nr:hypothetical protein [Nitratireductor sp.]